MVQTLWFFKSQLQWLVLFVCVIIAYWRGAAPERQAASVFVGMFVSDRLYHWAFGSGIVILRADLGHIVIDTAALAAFAVIALRANRLYPIWLASFQLMTIVSHIVRAISPDILTGAYAILKFAPSYLQVTGFGIGVLFHLRRQAKFGPYRSWQDF